MTNLMHNYVIQYVYYYNPLHVKSNSVLIIRRSNYINTASGIVFSVSDRPMCRCTPDGHLHRSWSFTQKRLKCLSITMEFIKWNGSDKPNVLWLYSGRQYWLSLWLTAVNRAIIMYAGMEIQFHTFLSPTVIDVSFSLQTPLHYSYTGWRGAGWHI